MNRLFPFVLTLSLLIPILTQNCIPRFSYEGFILTLQWPISFCYKSQSCSLKPQASVQEWTIHGLWPQFNWSKGAQFETLTGSRYLQYCCHPQRFDLTKLELLSSDLTQYWPSLKPASRKNPEAFASFWRHQWNKHGSCARDPFSRNSNQPISPEKYFFLALDLYRRLPVGKWLDRNQIKPSNQKTYRQIQIKQALDSGLGHPFGDNVFRLKCDPINQKISMLSEILICFDTELNLVQCNRFFPPNSNLIPDGNVCRDRVLLLKF